MDWMPIVFLRTIYKDFPFLSHNLSSQLEKREFSAGDSTTTYLLLCHEEQNILYSRYFRQWSKYNFIAKLSCKYTEQP